MKPAPVISILSLYLSAVFPATPVRIMLLLPQCPPLLLHAAGPVAIAAGMAVIMLLAGLIYGIAAAAKGRGQTLNDHRQQQNETKD